MLHDSPFSRGHTLGSDEGRMQQNELMDLVIKLSNRCEALETDLRQTKKVYGDAFTRLIKKVKKLEKTVKISQARRRSRVVISNNEEELEDHSKQGRSIIEEIDQDAGVTLVTPTHSQEDQPEDQLGVFSATKVLVYAAKNVYTYTRRMAVSTGSGGVSTASRLFSTAKKSVSTAGPSMPVSTASMVQEANTPSSIATKDKGKAIIYKKSLMQQRDRGLLECMKKLALSMLKNGKIYKLQFEADEELAQRMQAEEREKYSEAEKARLLAELINQRKNIFPNKELKKGGTSH
ncbi:hypothetical protein Tco_1436639 [Tanacetum coccineum]